MNEQTPPDPDQEARESIAETILTAPPELLGKLAAAVKGIVDDPGDEPQDEDERDGVLDWFRRQKSTTPPQHQVDPWEH